MSLWQSELSAHIDDNYIVQEFVDMQKMKVRMYEDGCIVDKELYFDFCPHFFVKNGKVVGE